MMTGCILYKIKGRTERDSNPRYAFTYTRFPGVPVRPLWHLSFAAPLESRHGGAELGEWQVKSDLDRQTVVEAALCWDAMD